jgi:tetratricopeptide (TPR) repeat protein
MTALHRFLVFGALVGLVAWISTPTQGEPTPGKTRLEASVKPIVPTQPTAQAKDFEAELAASKFAAQPVHVYEPVAGPLVVGMQIKPQLPAAPTRPRDYLILVSTSAAQAGAGWIGSNQIADAIVKTANDGDRIAIWTVGDKTEAVVEFVDAKADAKTLEAGLKRLAQLYPSGTTDLKTALDKAASAFSAEAQRQRIVLLLGDGQSTQNPLTHDDRAKISDAMVQRQVAFFAVPLGIQLDSDNLHGFATGTGGAVLRTRVNDEKLVDALKRYQEAFAAPILYDAKLQLPAEIIESYPQRLPPMRGDTPTLIVGRMHKAKSIQYTVTGTVSGLNAPTTTTAAIEVPEPDLDNFFLIRMADQWAKAKARPALLRGDRALTLAYNQTKVEHLALLLGAQLAMERNELDGATRLFGEAKKMSPRDPEAAAGLKVVARLKDGTLTRDALRNQLKRARVADVVKKEDGEVTITKTNFAALAQEPVPPPVEAAPLPDQLQQQRDRVLLEEQRTTQLVEEAMRDARRELVLDPDGAVEMLRNTLVRVEDNLEIGDRVRDTLSARLQTALREASAQGRLIKLRQEQENRILASVRERQERDAERRTFEDRQIQQFRRFKDAMARARFEEQTKNELLVQMIALENEARLKGVRPPVVVKVMYDQTQAQFNLQRAHDLRRLREERFLQTLLEVEKSHVPFPDEPGIFYPPLATWKAITAMRKEKYEVSSLPDDDNARKEANTLSRMLDEMIDMKDFQVPMTLKEALGLFYEKYQAKGKELPILIDQQAFKEENPDAPDLYETQVTFPPYPKMMTMSTALKLALSQVPTSDATYLIRRSFIEITTHKRAIEDRVLRVYPVGELVIPISQQGGLGQFQTGGAQFGGGGFGGGIQGFGGGIQGFGGGGIGGFGGGGIGGFGGGIGGFGGGIGGFGGGGQGFIGGQVTGSFQGGSFQGGFNGSLGQLGASQAVGLIDLITKVVDPGNWFYTQQAQPFNPTNFAQGFINPFGGGGNLGAPQGGFGNLGGGAPPPPVSQGGPADLQNSNTIEFFPPALALIVRAPSRVHTSITGGLIGSKRTVDEFARAHAEQRNLAMVKKGGRIEQPALAGVKNAKPKVLAQAENLPGKGKVANKGEDLDPKKVWEEAFAKGGIEPALVVATADFLFEMGKHDHLVEFLKANLRHGIVVRPWVYEALAVALEENKGDPEEIRRARLSAIALDPNDTQGFLEAARTMANAKQYDQALAFCRQAALLEPSLAQTYVDALAYAQDAKDTAAMEWAARQIVSQDWPVDNQMLHQTAQNRVEQLTRSLQNEQRGSEADRLRAALQMLKERDLVVVLSWDSVTGEAPAGIELQVKEPTGSVCSLQQKQTPGGGALLAGSLKEPNRATYTAALAFPGEYEISVRRLWGQTLGSRARVEVIRHLGTPRETRQLHIVRFDSSNTPLKVTLAQGRRTELATVSLANLERKQPDRDREELKGTSMLQKLRNMAFPDFSGATTTGGTKVRGTSPAAPRMAAGHSATAPALHSSLRGGAVQMTTEMRRGQDGRELDMVLRPVFQTVPAARPGANLPGIPGGL